MTTLARQPLGALLSLGYGGVGQRGSGRHYGIEGYREFFPRGGAVHRTRELADAIQAPRGSAAQATVDGAFSAGQAPGAAPQGGV